MSIPYLVNGEILALTAHRVAVASMEMDAMLTSQRLILLRNNPAGLNPLIIPLWCFISVAGTTGYTGEPGICVTFSVDDSGKPVQFDLLFQDNAEKSRQRERDQWLKAFMEGIVAARQKQVLTDIGDDIKGASRIPEGICLELPDNFIELLQNYPRATVQLPNLHAIDKPDDASGISPTEMEPEETDADNDAAKEAPGSIPAPKGRPFGIREMLPLRSPYHDSFPGDEHKDEIPNARSDAIVPALQDERIGCEQDRPAGIDRDKREPDKTETARDPDALPSCEHDDQTGFSAPAPEDLPKGDTGVMGETEIPKKSYPLDVIPASEHCRDFLQTCTPPAHDLPDPPQVSEEPESGSDSPDVSDSATSLSITLSASEETGHSEAPDAGREELSLIQGNLPPAPRRDVVRVPSVHRILLAGAIILGIVALIIAILSIGGLLIPGMESHETADAPVQNVSPTETAVPIVTQNAPAVLEPGTWIRVNYSNLYYGSIGSPGALHDVAGSGDQLYAVKTDNGIVQASIQKRDSSGDPLVLTLYRDGSLVAERSTTIPQGSVGFLLNITTGLPPGILQQEAHLGQEAGQSYSIEYL